MGYSNDLGTSTVKDVDPVTGYPRDEYGQLLRSVKLNDGAVTKDWDKPVIEHLFRGLKDVFSADPA